jgi:uncharacterized protein
MEDLTFAWDSDKSELNKRKHGISFEEAESVFYDEKAIEFYDPEHSDDEDRFLMLGMSFKLRILVVCYCLRDKGSVIRIISARKATRKEGKAYRRS